MMDARATIEHLMTILRAVLAPVVTDAYRAKFGKRYLLHIERTLKSDRYEPHFADEDELAKIDVMGWLNLTIRRWEEAFREIYFTDCRSYVGELIQARHRWAHQEDFSDADVYRILDTALRLFRVFELTDAANQIVPLRLAWLARMKDGESTSTASPQMQVSRPPVPVISIPKTPVSLPPNGTLENQIAELAAKWTKLELRAEVVRILRAIPFNHDLPLTVMVAPRYHAAASEQARFIILPPEAPHRPEARMVENSAALKVTANWSAADAASHVVSLAMDMDGAKAVGDAVRQWLAVVHLSRQHPKQISNVHRQTANEAVVTALQRAYRWLIVMKDGGLSVVELDDPAPLIEPAVRAAQFYLR